MDTAKYISMFLQEVRDNLASLNQLTVRLEKEPTNMELLQEIMRLSHSSKSVAASVGFQTTSDLFHALEDVFDAARHAKLTVTSAIVDACFRGLDQIDQSLHSIESTGQEVDCGTATAALQEAYAAAQSGQSSSATTEQPATDTRSQNTTEQPAARINFIRVTTEKVDTITNLAGELTLLRQQIRRAQQEDNVPSTLVEELDRLVEELTYHAIDMRLVPLEQAFAQFPRLVRDLAHAQNKQVRFAMQGTDINLDKTLVDHLIAPVTHLLRNAVDHGIESAEERAQAGKNPESTILLKVERTHGFVQVSVEDDGRAIDPDRLKTIAKKRGFSDAMLQNITAENVLDLLSSPGFSSSETVSDISGRGVGLSAVQQSVQTLGGSVTLTHSAKHKTFQLSLPLQLSIVPSLLVDVSLRRYALPLIHITRLLPLHAADVQSAMGQRAIVLDDCSVPLLFLSDLLAVHTQESTAALPDGVQHAAPQHHTVILVGTGDQVVGLVVDAVLGHESIMVKPVSEVIRSREYYAGSTILPDGRVALILDVPSLIRAYELSLSSSPS